MIDIHSHILFGVDDGAKTINESMELIKEAISKGVTHLILTPHFNKRNYSLKQDNVFVNYQLLKEKTVLENLNIHLFLGNEVYLTGSYSIISENGFYTLADSNYILIEFNEIIPPDNIPEICYEINVAGYIPIIAHAERYEIFHNNIKLLAEILNEGVHLQVNASSVIKKEDNKRNKLAHFLLKNELISFVASDVHNTTNRKFYLDKAYKEVCKHDACYGDKIFKQNQLNIIKNISFESPKPKLKQTFKNRFFK